MTKVVLSELTKEFIGRSVKYLPKNEKGTITSFNSRFVFVCYDATGRGIATSVRNLVYVEDVKLEKCISNQDSCTFTPNKLHTCPYLEEIKDDYKTLCNCCNNCIRQCAMNV